MNVSFCVAAFAWRPGTFLISHAKQVTLERWREKEIRSDAAYLSVLHRIFCLSFCPRPRYNLCCSFLEKLTHMHTHMHTHIHTHIHTYIHAYIHTCVHTYIHTYIYIYIYTYTYTYTYHFVTHNCFTTSFVFPSFPVPATTFGAHYWKKLTCGVIRSFNCF